LIEDFIANFNKHRKEMFCPGARIEADESMCRWYGAGDDYINHGLPHYSVIDRKPDNGLELQNIVCVESGIMLYLKLVKSAKEKLEMTVSSSMRRSSHMAKVPGLYSN
jgi:hypothetical protein